MATDTREADAWWEAEVGRLKFAYSTTDVWDIPRDVWHEAQRGHTERLRVAYGRDPKSGEVTPEARASARKEAREALEDASVPEAPAQATITAPSREDAITRLRGL